MNNLKHEYLLNKLYFMLNKRVINFIDGIKYLYK